MKRRWLVLVLGSVALGGIVGCAGRRAEDPILRLSSSEALTEGKGLMESEAYSKARRYLTHAFEVEPNSPSGREALLLVADSLYLEGGRQNQIQAEAKYRDFLNRFPTSDRAGYVQLQIANTLFERLERPDRDQTVTREARVAYEELLRLYPETDFAAEAEERIEVLDSRLADHEYMVGFFYLRYGLPEAAAKRFEGILDQFPEYGEMDKVLYHLGRAYDELAQPDEAGGAWNRLREEFPDSEWVSDLEKEGAG